MIGRKRSRGSVCRDNSASLPTGEIANDLNHQDTKTPREIISEDRAYNCFDQAAFFVPLCLCALVPLWFNS